MDIGRVALVLHLQRDFEHPHNFPLKVPSLRAFTHLSLSLSLTHTHTHTLFSSSSLYRSEFFLSLLQVDMIW